MHLKDQGFKFCISPDKKQGQWLHPTVFKVMHPDWTDVTEWPDVQLLAFLMPAPQQQELFAAWRFHSQPFPRVAAGKSTALEGKA